MIRMIMISSSNDDYLGSDRAAIHHYNHEFSRERWEHDIAPEHEVEVIVVIIITQSSTSY